MFCEGLTIFLYMFLMMFLNLVYHFDDCVMVSMLKHPESMCLGLGFIFVSCKSVLVHHLSSWIDSIHTESIHLSLWLHVNRFTSPWIDSCMNRLFSTWIVSQNSLNCTKSIHKKHESYHSSSWVHLNRFTYALNRLIL